MNPRNNSNVANQEDDAEMRSLLAGMAQRNKEDAEKRKNAANRSFIGGISGQLEIPRGNNPFQNAWLTLTLSYDLRFLDSRVRNVKFTNNSSSSDVIVEHKDLGLCARDLDDFLFPILDWGYDSIKDFLKIFQQGEAIWNHKFLIVPPLSFDRLDYTSSAFPGYVMRPNILCLFRMTSGGTNAKTFNVVRINPSVFEDPKFEVPNYRTKKTKSASSGFRSHAEMLTDDDLQRPVLGHELGHAINEDHILAMKGDAQCKIDPNLDRCYGLTPEEVRNIMGSGREITEINARPWLDHLQQITGCDPINCVTVLLTDSKIRPLPPSKIPVAKPKPALGLIP